MEELFAIDKRDYNPDGRVHVRPSARAIIERDGRFLVMHSRKYDYFKFPGGGIEAGETPEQAMIREVREETGYFVKPETIEEYGRVLRRNRDAKDPEAIFEQQNYYYFCEIGEERVPVVREDYEIEEGFEPLWVDNLFALVRRNRRALRSGADAALVEREMRVFDLADEALRRRRMAREEAEAIAALRRESQGNMNGGAGKDGGSQGDASFIPDYADMLAFVKETLEASQTEGQHGVGVHKVEFGYSRFEHTKRVLGWSRRLYDKTQDKNGLRFEDLMIATIFHDVGRAAAIIKDTDHAAEGVPITREYLLAHGYPEERVAYICGLVRDHSLKQRMADPDIDRNLLMLMEADLLDDMGALGIVMDSLIVRGRNENATFFDCYNHYCRYTLPMQKESPMVTPEGRFFWDEKTDIVQRFVEHVHRDISI
ncbi:MAG: NUDIX domain-containing protein [Lachnospiraceae bacterium]|nr:NUDIX domain-containing protein [Lachnospiraceae bacterium]